MEAMDIKTDLSCTARHTFPVLSLSSTMGRQRNSLSSLQLKIYTVPQQPKRSRHIILHEAILPEMSFSWLSSQFGFTLVMVEQKYSFTKLGGRTSL